MIEIMAAFTLEGSLSDVDRKAASEVRPLSKGEVCSPGKIKSSNLLDYGWNAMRPPSAARADRNFA
jgi:hypothetical protein